MTLDVTTVIVLMFSSNCQLDDVESPGNAVSMRDCLNQVDP